MPLHSSPVCYAPLHEVYQPSPGTHCMPSVAPFAAPLVKGDCLGCIPLWSDSLFRCHRPAEARYFQFQDIPDEDKDHHNMDEEALVLQADPNPQTTNSTSPAKACSLYFQRELQTSQ